MTAAKIRRWAVDAVLGNWGDGEIDPALVIRHAKVLTEWVSAAIEPAEPTRSAAGCGCTAEDQAETLGKGRSVCTADESSIGRSSPPAGKGGGDVTSSPPGDWAAVTVAGFFVPDMNDVRLAVRAACVAAVSSSQGVGVLVRFSPGLDCVGNFIIESWPYNASREKA